MRKPSWTQPVCVYIHKPHHVYGSDYASKWISRGAALRAGAEMIWKALKPDA